MFFEVYLILKKFIKFLIFLCLVVFLSFALFFFFSSDESRATKLLQVISDEMGYESNIEISKLDWNLTKQTIILENFKLRKTEERSSLDSDLVEIQIDWLNLFSKKSFLEFRSDLVNIELEDFDLNHESLNQDTNVFFLNKIKTDVKVINIRGSINEINLTQYFGLFSNSLNYSPFILKAEDLFVSNLNIGPLHFSNTKIGMVSTSKGREFNFSNEQLKGRLLIKQPIVQGLEIRLSTLDLNLGSLKGGSTFKYLFENLTIPIDFSTNHLVLENNDYGNLSFLIRKEEEGLYFNDIEFSYFNLEKGGDNKKSIENSLFISEESSNLRSNLQGFVNIDSLNEYVGRFDKEVEELNFIAGPSEVSFELSWEGFPDEFSTKDLIGSLSFRVDEFNTTETKSGGIGRSNLFRLISLFNVSRTFDGLTNLNFKEKFKKGFRADRIEGVVEIKKDVITITEPIVFSTGSGEFKWSGFMQRNRHGDLENLDLEVLITLPLREYLPAYALILGGPITAATVYIAGKAFKKPINKLSSGKWKVSGDIEDPKAKFIEWFE